VAGKRTALRYCLVKRSGHRYYTTKGEALKHWKAGDALYVLRNANWHFWTPAGLGGPIAPTWQGGLPARLTRLT